MPENGIHDNMRETVSWKARSYARTLGSGKEVRVKESVRQRAASGCPRGLLEKEEKDAKERNA